MILFSSLLISSRSIKKLFLFLMAATASIVTLLLGYYVYLGGSLSSPPPLGGLFFAPKIEYPPYPLTPPGLWPGIRQPPALPAEEAKLDEHTEVIGVCIGGRARAYSVEALSGKPNQHVVNDVLAGRPVSVCYCDRMDCGRVFTMSSTGSSLDLDVGGWQHGKGMILKIHDIKYALKDGENLTDADGPPLPYQRLEHKRTTWGEWLRAHPQSDVYVGLPE